MTTGLLALMCLTLGQNADDYYNYRSPHHIPVIYNGATRNDTDKVLLYVTTDQGRNWHLHDTIPNSKNEFIFHATADGIFGLSVAMVNKQGKQEPDEKTIMTSPPQLKMVIDTQKPIIRKLETRRVGDEVYVNWETQEDYPAPNGVKLEYQVKDAAGAWMPIAGTHPPSGQARFRPGNAASLLVRLTVSDLARNQSFALSEAAGTLAAAGFNNPGQGITNSETRTLPTLPGGLTAPAPIETPGRVETRPVPPPKPMDELPIAPINVAPPIEVKAPPAPASFIEKPPADFGSKPTPTPPVVRDPIPPMRRDTPPAPPSAPIDPIGAIGLAADSRTPVRTPEQTNDSSFTRTQVNSSPARKPLPPLMYLNSHQVTLEYEMKRLGPSGVGGVELWLTKDDGNTWEPYAKAEDAVGAAPVGRQKRTFDFRDLNTDQPFTDGIYGLILVVKNRAGVGRQPRAGDTPEIRIEIDKEQPLAQLYEPIPDPQRPDHVLIMWNALDKNLTQAPVNLEFAESREGPWRPIKLDLENKGRYPGKDRTGDFSWKVPADIPVQVYLRLTVRDRAGNESVAVTDRPHYVDLIEPEGALVGVQPASKR